MRKYILLSIIFVICLITNDYLEAHVIGYGYANSVLPAKNQEAFYTGFELGLKEILGDKDALKLLATEQVLNGSPTGAIKALKSLLDKGVRMIVGFPTSHEAVQVAKLTSKEGYLTVFASAGHSSLAEMGPTIFTTGESMNSFVEETIKLIQGRFSKQKGLFIYNPQALFSVNQKNEFERQLKAKNGNVPNFEYKPLDMDLRINNTLIMDLKQGKFKYLFLSPYADESAVVLNQLASEKIDLPIVSNSTLTTGDNNMVRRILSTKKSSIIAGPVWVPNMPNLRHFEKLFTDKYGTAPSAESASGYDLGIITGNVILRAKGNFSKQGLLAAFHADHCFDQTTVGKICFPPNGGHGSKAVVFKRLTNTGLTDL